MPGDEWQRFANLRAYFGFMWAHPGKKLLFMGGEFAQEHEWNHDRGLDWHLLDAAAEQPACSGWCASSTGCTAPPRRCGGAISARTGSAGWCCTIASSRCSRSCVSAPEGDAPMLAVCNFTPVPRQGYRIGVPCGGDWRETFNSDAALFGGSNLGNGGWCAAEPIASHGEAWSLLLVLPPLSTIYLQAPA